MEKPTKVTEETFKAFTKAMRNVLGPSSNPSRNFLKREIENPTQRVGCRICGATRTTLYAKSKVKQQYRVDGEEVVYCGPHRPF